MRIILVGKAASGKDYLRDEMVSRGMTPDISYTSRPMRVGEADGVTYNYVSEAEFEALIRRGKMHEYVKFNGWYYGTTLVSWNTSDVFIMTPSGVAQMSNEDRATTLVVYLDIPMDVRRERLKLRSDCDSVERRILADEKVFETFTTLEYDMEITDPKFIAEDEIM
mgnify:CR=1 FL=1